MAEAVAGLRAALPVELHLDAAVAVGVQGLTGADDDGGLGAWHEGLVQGDAAASVGGQVAYRHAQALGAEERSMPCQVLDRKFIIETLPSSMACL